MFLLLAPCLRHTLYRVLLATVRFMGSCFCPRCTTTKAQIPDLGMLRDAARRERNIRKDDNAFQQDARTAYKAIYTDGYGPNSRYIERLLGKKSYVPTKVSIITLF
jgi:hypothetical protein